MTEESGGKLRTLLHAYAERKAKPEPVVRGTHHEEGERKRRACGEMLRTVVRPVLDEFQAELRGAGYEASTRDQTGRDDAYPSVALSFTPPSALASALIFRYDPRHGIAVQRDVKASPRSRRITMSSSGDRGGTSRVDAVSAAWVEIKTLNFIEAVLKAN
ncbi:MAG TPA: hypothetical protein VJ816_07560 [Gemmatimonadales bacterium]|nr:hypothetical protein [Gemmatimonadales bacterium]